MSPLSRYEKELLHALPRGRKLRKLVLEEFHQSLFPLTEEIPQPTYDDLVGAFGTPEEMAQTLTQSLTHLPKPLSRKRVLLWGLAGCAALLLAVGLFLLQGSQPEKTFSLTAGELPQDLPSAQQYNCYQSPFVSSSLRWEQAKEDKAYQIEIRNPNPVELRLIIAYQDRKQEHDAVIPPEATRVLTVNDAKPGEHVIFFQLSPVALSLELRLLVSQDPLSPP